MALAERLPTPLRETPVSRATRGQARDGVAFAELVERYDRTVYNVALSMVRNSQDAEDIAQEVWIKVANNLANLRDQNLFLPWLYRISRNCSLTFLSSQKNRHLVTNTDDDDQATNLPSSPTDNPEAQAISEAERREVWAALNALSESDRKILLLREFQELPYEQIAGILGISRGNAEVRVFRARMRFRQQFSKRSEGTVARGFLGLPLLGLLAKLRLAFGFSATTSASTGSTAAGTGIAAGSAAATGGAAAGTAAASTGIAAQMGAGIAAKIAISAASLTLAAGAVAVAAPEVAPIIEAPVAALVQQTHEVAPAQLSTAARPAEQPQPQAAQAQPIASDSGPDRATRLGEPTPATGSTSTGNTVTNTKPAAPSVPSTTTTAPPTSVVITSLPGDDFVYVTLPAVVPSTAVKVPSAAATASNPTSSVVVSPSSGTDKKTGGSVGSSVDDDPRPPAVGHRGDDDNRNTTVTPGKDDDGKKTTDAGNTGDDGKKTTDAGNKVDDGKKTTEAGNTGDDGKRTVDAGNKGDDDKKTVDAGNKGDDGRKTTVAGNTGDDGRKTTEAGNKDDDTRKTSDASNKDDDGKRHGRH